MADPTPRDVPVDLDALEALANAATPGPWYGGSYGGSIIARGLGAIGTAYGWPCPNGVFIAAAREAVPALIAQVRESDRLLSICRDNPREEDAERIAELEAEVERLRAASAPVGAQTDDDFDPWFIARQAESFEIKSMDATKPGSLPHRGYADIAKALRAALRLHSGRSDDEIREQIGALEAMQARGALYAYGAGSGEVKPIHIATVIAALRSRSASPAGSVTVTLTKAMALEWLTDLADKRSSHDLMAHEQMLYDQLLPIVEGER